MRSAILATLLLALAALSGCATNPVTGGQDFVLMSEDQEISAGQRYHQQVLQQYPPYEDENLQAYVSRVGEELARKSHRANLVFHFTVLDSQDVNAFALPGGYIYITRGIMAYMNSEAELAGVLGHEIGHGFDDQGSQYDERGNLENWWTDADRAAFQERADKLIAQYSGYSPRDLPDETVNGQLTVGDRHSAIGDRRW